VTVSARAGAERPSAAASDRTRKERNMAASPVLGIVGLQH
jgi:hypothetical protein